LTGQDKSQTQGVFKMQRVVADRAIHAAALSHGDTRAIADFQKRKLDNLRRHL